MFHAVIVSGIYAESQKDVNPGYGPLENYLESVIGVINENALYKTNSQNVVRDMLKAYVKSIDPYADYLDKEEYEAFKAFEKAKGINVGITPKRTQPEEYPIKIDSYGEYLFIKIIHFTSNMAKVVKNRLKDVEGTRPIVIDLRENRGGDINGAIDCTMLFLKEGQKIVDIKNNKGINSFKNTMAPVNRESPIYLWQDKKTEGVAEVFIAALTQNKRAVSIGGQSGGKGTYQEIIELSDGAALKLTTSLFLPPDGTSYDKHGIGPTYALDMLSPDENSYWPKTIEVHKGKDVPVVSPDDSPREGFFICFETEFDSGEEAEFWALEVKNSINNPPDQFLLETTPDDNGRTKFKVCLGPFENKDAGTKKLSHVTEEMNTPMFVEMMTISD